MNGTKVSFYLYPEHDPNPDYNPLYSGCIVDKVDVVDLVKGDLPSGMGGTTHGKVAVSISKYVVKVPGRKRIFLVRPEHLLIDDSQ